MKTKHITHMDINRSYKTLGVYPGSTVEEIKSAYKTQVKLYHPDLYDKKSQQEYAKDRLVQVNLAYEKICSHLEEEPDIPTPLKKPEQYYQVKKEPPPEFVKNRNDSKIAKSIRPIAEVKKSTSYLDKAYSLAKIRSNERITTRIQELSRAEAEINKYKNQITKKYFKNKYYDIDSNKKLNLDSLKKLFSGVNAK